MLLNGQRLVGQGFGFFIRQAKQHALFGRHIHKFNGFAQAAVGGVDHLGGFGADIATQYGRTLGPQIGFVDVVFVGVDRALNHAFTQTEGGGDEHHVLKAGFGVNREHHTGCALVGTDHALDAGRQRHLLVGEALMHAV